MAIPTAPAVYVPDTVDRALQHSVSLGGAIDSLHNDSMSCMVPVIGLRVPPDEEQFPPPLCVSITCSPD
jgi:hypothetical protein